MEKYAVVYQGRVQGSIGAFRHYVTVLEGPDFHFVRRMEPWEALTDAGLPKVPDDQLEAFLAFLESVRAMYPTVEFAAPVSIVKRRAS